MSTSKHTITQVRDILRKLDRSIDDARERRTTNGRPVPGDNRVIPTSGHGQPGVNGRPH